MDTILEFVKNLNAFETVYDGFIIVLSLYIFTRLSKINNTLYSLCKKSESAYKETLGETKIDLNGNLSREIQENYNREKHEPIRKEYNEQAVSFVKYVNLISILPLLGLMGTILGLIPGLTAVKQEDFETLYSALSTALSSTFLGLLMSIILKAYVAIKPDVLANRIEMLFEEIDRKYDNAIGLNKLKELKDNGDKS